MTQGILFDLDDTLTDRPASLKQFTLRFSQHFADQLGEMSFDALHEVMIRADGGGYCPPEKRFSIMQHEIAWKQPPSFQALWDYWYTVLSTCSLPKAHLYETLDSLKQAGFVMGIVTNGRTDPQTLTIDTLKLHPYMQTVIVSERVGVRKPNRQIFEKALDALGIALENTWFVGDHPLNDMLGARSMGMKGIWMIGSHEWPDEHPHPDYQIENLRELLPILLKQA